ncbi:xylulokinase [Propionibacterium cyclohexanicum]|uniref:Xylulose kinase n=1 Tax=Propionibacterium cyclohexanicum TaxID=64702 RepID=A0A1H9TUG4_9ACTN|nr:FGGY family carbohydrate kinase [Propionibacterium cyclohexanicum]SES00587.1 xylulokinase [Propionibacterium cyclohexanicum]
MNRRYVAGVDSSTQSCKVVIFDPRDGSVVRQGRGSHPEGTEVDPERWWQGFLDAVQAAGGLDDVAALSVAGQQHGMVCLDEAGHVIRPALLWNDTRSAEAARALIDELGEADAERGAAVWAELTGSVPVASLTVTKLRWLADHEPEHARRTAAICLPHDWLTWRIAGSRSVQELVTDRSDASGTGYTEIGADRYRPELAARALHRTQDEMRGIVLPRILGPWVPAGHGDPARGWGDIVLGPGCGDNAGAALGLGLRPGQALLSLGTSGVVAAVSDHPVSDPSGSVTGFADASGRWLPLACTLNASRITDAIARILGVGYEEYSRLALSVPDAAGLVLTPYFEGERTPNLPDATASLVGMTLANATPAHVARAGVEGLLTLMRGAMDAVRAQGVAIDQVEMVGGGAQLGAVRELAASRLGATVNVPPAGEYVALGAARQAARVLAG